MIRPAAVADVPAILSLVRELAAYEREPDAVEATEELLAAALFGPAAVASCHVVDVGAEVVGFALWYVTFSTWKGRPGLWLEDLYIRPSVRGSGWGKALLRTLATVCVERGYPRFEWWVLDWNVDAQGFYRSVGATPEDDWTVWRVSGDALGALGTRSSQALISPPPAPGHRPGSRARR